MIPKNKELNNKKIEIEKIINENGTAIKFSDGTMIQRGTVNCNSSGYGQVNFPVAFSSADVIMTANNIYNQSGEMGAILTIQSDTKTVGIVYFWKYVDGNITPITNTAVGANWIAIGKWK